MAKKDLIKTKNILLELLPQKGISIDKIVVFGSYAKGRARPDSDIDLIVVSKQFRGKDVFDQIEMIRGVHRELVKRVKKPFDILYYSDTEWKRGDSLIISAAKREGKVLYG